MNAKVIKSEPPESTALMAASIVKISTAMDKLLKEPGGLTERAIVLLVHDLCGVGKPDIRLVLKALPQLRGYYCRKV